MEDIIDHSTICRKESLRKGYIGDKDMKKSILIAAMALITMFAVSCGNADENKESPTPAAQSAQTQTSQVNKGEFSQIPQDAEKGRSGCRDGTAVLRRGVYGLRRSAERGNYLYASLRIYRLPGGPERKTPGGGK